MNRSQNSGDRNVNVRITQFSPKCFAFISQNVRLCGQNQCFGQNGQFTEFSQQRRIHDVGRRQPAQILLPGPFHLFARNSISAGKFVISLVVKISIDDRIKQQQLFQGQVTRLRKHRKRCRHSAADIVACNCQMQ